MKKLKVVGLNFDHMHMGDLLRMCHGHPEVEIAGICDEDPARMQTAVTNFGIPAGRVFTDPQRCLTETEPDFVVLCPATARHAEYVELAAKYRVHMLVEKPFAATLREADRMIAAAKRARRLLAINWPLRWYPAHVTAHRLLREGRIGALQEVHFYDGNRGPLYHLADKIEVEPTPAMKRKSWFYKKAAGGGSLLDYLGYGTTLGSWYHGGKKPLEVTTVVDETRGLEVDQHSVTLARYATGLSKFETRWGTFTDPWTQQPQPKCGFVLKGEDGTISSYDFEPTVRLQTRTNVKGEDVPVDALQAPEQNPIQYFVSCIRNGLPVEGPLSPRIARIGQQIVDSAVLSARLKKTVKLID
ncbi:MAG: Gfo/Idh/MocA family oxidoreductase [Verrucomicrobia bacterium]|nr:Gfo/Idh/MocA family oxidoreductase [Verrucomicrobiota bacterium]